MSNAAAPDNAGLAASAVPDEPSAPRRPPQAFSAIVLRQTFAAWGARIGIVWIVVLALAAVFAPFIANSHPVLLKTSGKWSSPLLENLTAADLILLAAFFTGLLLLFLRQIPGGTRWRLWIAALLASLLFIGWPAIAETLSYGLSTWLGGAVRLVGGAIMVMAAWLALSRTTLRPWLKWTLGVFALGVAAWLLTRPAVIAPFDVLSRHSGSLTIWLRVGVRATAVKAGAGLALVLLGSFWLIRSSGARGQRLVAGAWLVLLAGAFSCVTVHPPVTEVLEGYRQLEQTGQVQWALYTPVPFSPTDRQRQTDFERSHNMKPVVPFSSPGTTHWMGTDDNAQDVFARILHAARIALAIGLIATSIEVVVGVTIGGLMGYFVGWVDLVGMRLIEIIEAVPTLFLLITFVAFFDRNIYVIMAIIGLTGWTGNARFIRAEFLRLRQQDFVVAARACGLPLYSILFRHMLPNGMAPVLVGASFGIASAILYEATLTFLGLGLPPGDPSWGQLLNQARGVGGGHWWILIYPGLVIFLTVFSYNLIGESLRDAIDPHSRRVSQL